MQKGVMCGHIIDVDIVCVKIIFFFASTEAKKNWERVGEGEIAERDFSLSLSFSQSLSFSLFCFVSFFKEKKKETNLLFQCDFF